MSSTPHPDGIKAPDPHVWRNNAAFDGGVSSSTEITSSKGSWLPSNPIFLNSLDIDSDKENQNPVFDKSLTFTKSTIPIEPLLPNAASGKTLKRSVEQSGSEDKVDENIDAQIEEVEKEISRLSTKLKSLRLRKAEKDLKAAARLATMGSTEFGENLQSLKNHGRGLSLDQSETEKLQHNVSIQSMQKRRKSCFSKLLDEGKAAEGDGGVTVELTENNVSRVPEVMAVEETGPIQARKKPPILNLGEFNEDKVTKQRGGRSLSLSPESRLPVTMIKDSKRRLTTVGSKKAAKKGSGFLSSIKPKKLCSEGGKCVGHKKQAKDVKVIASRYTQISSQKPENDKEYSKGCHEKCTPSVERSDVYQQDFGMTQVTGTKRVKKRWEIPGEIIIHESLTESPSPPVSGMANLLPKIRTNRCVKESSRDSGPAKRVVELVGRKSYFGAESMDGKSSVCQVLGFNEEEEE